MGKWYWRNGWKKHLQSVYKTNDQGKHWGILYFYEVREISRVNEWKDGNEVKVLKQFLNDNTMIEYKDGAWVHDKEFLE